MICALGEKHDKIVKYCKVYICKKGFLTVIFHV